MIFYGQINNSREAAKTPFYTPTVLYNELRASTEEGHLVRNFSRWGMLFSILHKNLCCENEMRPHTVKQCCTGRTL